jgi:flagellar biosynthesis regulator FlaF
MSAHHLNAAVWKKSSRSNGNGGNNCVEVAILDAAVAVRDSKNQSGPALVFNAAQWTAFVNSAKEGEFDIVS